MGACYWEQGFVQKVQSESLCITETLFITSLLYPTQKTVRLNKIICILIYLSACKFLRDLPLLTVDQLMYTCIINASINHCGGSMPFCTGLCFVCYWPTQPHMHWGLPLLNPLVFCLLLYLRPLRFFVAELLISMWDLSSCLVISWSFYTSALHPFCYNHLHSAVTMWL